ncbi:hypothetical protein Spiro2_000081 [Spirobacillus cienkowskii]|jgi:hypothetical protein
MLTGHYYIKKFTLIKIKNYKVTLYKNFPSFYLKIFSEKTTKFSTLKIRNKIVF